MRCVAIHGLGKISLGVSLRALHNNNTLIFLCRDREPWNLMRCLPKFNIALYGFDRKPFAVYELLVYNSASGESVDAFCRRCARSGLAGVVVTDEPELKRLIYRQAVAIIVSCGTGFPEVFKEIVAHKENDGKTVFALENDHEMVEKVREANKVGVVPSLVPVIVDCIAVNRTIDYLTGEVRVYCEQKATLKLLDPDNIFLDSPHVDVEITSYAPRLDVDLHLMKKLLNSDEVKNRSGMESTMKTYLTNLPHSLVAYFTWHDSFNPGADPLIYKEQHLFENLDPARLSCLRKLIEAIIPYPYYMWKIGGYPQADRHREYYKVAGNIMKRFFKAKEDKIGRILWMNDLTRFRKKLNWILQRLDEVLFMYKDGNFALSTAIDKENLKRYIGRIEHALEMISGTLRAI